MEFKWLIAQLISKENKNPKYLIFKISMLDCFNMYYAFSLAIAGQNLHKNIELCGFDFFCVFDDFPINFSLKRITTISRTLLSML